MEGQLPHPCTNVYARVYLCSVYMCVLEGSFLYMQMFSAVCAIWCVCIAIWDYSIKDWLMYAVKWLGLVCAYSILYQVLSSLLSSLTSGCSQASVEYWLQQNLMSIQLKLVMELTSSKYPTTLFNAHNHLWSITVILCCRAPKRVLSFDHSEGRKTPRTSPSKKTPKKSPHKTPSKSPHKSSPKKSSS